MDNATPIQSIVVKCPRCKYDLRVQVGPPVPVMVTCPECGTTTQSYQLLNPNEKRQLRSIWWYVFVPLPGFFIVCLAVMILLPEEMRHYAGPILWLSLVPFAATHMACVAVTAAKRSRHTSKWDRAEVAFNFGVLALVADCVMFGGLVMLAGFWRPH